MLWLLSGLFAIAFVVILILYRQNARKKEQSGSGALTDRMNESEAGIKNVDPGDLISIAGISDLSRDYKDIVFEVKRKNRYDCDGDRWYEYSGQVGKTTYSVEWSEDDEIRITATSSMDEYKLSEIGLTEDDLARMDNEESNENYLEFKGKKFFYESSDEIIFFRDDRGSGEGFYLWDFLSEDEREMITVEKWEGEPFEVIHSYILSPDHINISKR